ncbi:MAG: oxygen-independent coproporphyrinogen III oxidase [Burkholderiales bacterium]|nr:oxygen-independent coproporphyrinogen III oxidase [Burkholderiales bacterium]
MNYTTIDFDKELITNCQTNAPRYTSYPTADRFTLDFTKDQQVTQIMQVFTTEFDEQISLYIHIPFCNTLCLYCGCNKIITNNRANITQYIKYLEKEFELYFALTKKKLSVIQLHFGGGSPSWLSVDEVSEIMTLIRKYFDLSNSREIAMELDPRHVTTEFMENLANEGFNRVSLGVQDFDYKVQKAVNRIQPFEDTKRVLDDAARLGFSSTSIDLIYGLPLQNLASYEETIDIVINQLKPARIALFNYAHLPHLIMPQTRINEADLPSASEKLNILQMCVERLTSAGYVFIGMDHFALPDDELAKALFDGTLQRNFQGYSTFADAHMLSFGVSSIGFVGNSYYQNAKDLESYYSSIDNGQLPILRGMMLNNDDVLRREIIIEIMCQFELNFDEISKKHNIVSQDYFIREINELKDLAKIGLLEMNESGFAVSNKGRFLIRNVAKVFDKYLNQNLDSKRYSKVI